MDRKQRALLALLMLFILASAYFRSLLGAIIIHSEGIGSDEIVSMLRGRMAPQNTVRVKTKTGEVLLPLPNNSAKYSSKQYPGPPSGNQYLTSTTKLDKYFAEELPQYGWKKVDQMGSSHVIEAIDAKETVHIGIDHFTHFYLRLTYN